MTLTRRQLWKLAAKLVSLLLFLLVIGSCYQAVKAIVLTWNWREAGFLLIALLAFVPAIAGCVWVAFRLWNHWNVATARWASFTLMGVLLFIAVAELPGLLQKFTGRHFDRVILVTPLLLIDLYLYRRIISRIVRWAQLDDPLDIYGQTEGHFQRAKIFAIVLGWSIWLDGSGLERFFKIAKHQHGLDVVIVLGPAILGWAVYRLIVWRARPRTLPALTAGYGFEVQPVSQRIAPDRQVIPDASIKHG